jgi:hypothetical protein
MSGLLFLTSCNPDNLKTDPVIKTIDPTGSWQNSENDSLVLAFGIVEGNDTNRVFICDQTSKSSGCLWADFKSNNTLVFDDSKVPEFIIEKNFNNQLILKTTAGVANKYEGTYFSVSWPEGSCGYFSKAGNTIGVIEDVCIVGEWYTLVPDPFGGLSTLVYKNYHYNGNGEIIFPDQNKTISFKWNISTDPLNKLLFEYQFTDPDYSDVSYGFICTSSGLALGLDGKSWIRKSIVCY